MSLTTTVLCPNTLDKSMFNTSLIIWMKCIKYIIYLYNDSSQSGDLIVRFIRFHIFFIGKKSLKAPFTGKSDRLIKTKTSGLCT